uniref:Uncharacterized protein n=1 Tax=Brassica oleracea TaxID=3712 RepID=A0A3P6DKW9_BRAOL|nr:unnamed protein product [Brassica oleracea]
MLVTDECLERFPTLSTGIRLTGKWNPLLRSISTAGSRRRVEIVKASTVDSDYSSRRSSSNEQRESIMLPGCDYNTLAYSYLNTLATVLEGFFLSS